MREVILKLSGVHAKGVHGVLDFEHRQAQSFVADIEYTVVFPDSAGVCGLPGESLQGDHLQDTRLRYDALQQTISYAEVADLAVARIEGAHAELIETLAMDIADGVLGMGARKVKVTVHKPQAPIPHEFTDVSATVVNEQEILQPKARRYIIGLGSNLEDSVAHLQAACMEICAFCGEQGRASAIYRSAPVLAPGQEAQPDYYNAVLEVKFAGTPLDFLHVLQGIEADHGRIREERWGARTLDLDLIAGDFTSADIELTLPHPRAHLRRFVLAPWLEIQPEARLLGRSLGDFLAMPEISGQRLERTAHRLIPDGIANFDRRAERNYCDTVAGGTVNMCASTGEGSEKTGEKSSDEALS